MVEAFKLRGAATKFGYTRGPAQDGGWFFEYLKRFAGLELEVHLKFSGNGLPEENRLVALTTLSFQRTSSQPDVDMRQGGAIPLSEIPAVYSERYDAAKAAWPKVEAAVAAAGVKDFAPPSFWIAESEVA